MTALTATLHTSSNYADGTDSRVQSASLYRSTNTLLRIFYLAVTDV